MAKPCIIASRYSGSGPTILALTQYPLRSWWPTKLSPPTPSLYAIWLPSARKPWTSLVPSAYSSTSLTQFKPRLSAPHSLLCPMQLPRTARARVTGAWAAPSLPPLPLPPSPVFRSPSLPTPPPTRPRTWTPPGVLPHCVWHLMDQRCNGMVTAVSQCAMEVRVRHRGIVCVRVCVWSWRGVHYM